jgi:hypothetical protein
MPTVQTDHNAVISAIKQADFAPKTLRFGRLKLYEGWRDEKFTRGRVTFQQTDGPQISYFVHIGTEKLKVWEDNSNNPSPNYILDGVFIS